MSKVVLGRGPLSIADLDAIAHRRANLEVAENALQALGEMRRRVATLLSAEAPNVYGVNTGFGALAEVRVAPADLARLQLNLVRSHCTGVGQPYPHAVVRAIMALRANVLLKTTSGVRPTLPALLIEMIRRDVLPVIPEKGSVGASGDLAPLAHLAAVMIGEGEAEFDGVRLPGADALARAGLQPIALEAKEGLALINGTQAMTADALLVQIRAERLCKLADVAGATSLEALLGTARAFDPRIHEARGHPGQSASARNLVRLCDGSEITESHRECTKVQDPYSLRCMPQVHGATRDAVAHAGDVLAREINAATDNPLVFEAGDTIEVISGGNFHGQPVALVADYLGIALAELANIAERRIEQLVNPQLSSGLPPFLTPESGLNSGFMIAQVTAAALVSENKVLSHPASVDSIPSSANREDHVSMGTFAARKARIIAENVEFVIAIELLCGAQGVDLRAPLLPGAGATASRDAIRAQVPGLTGDRTLGVDIERVTELVRDGRLLAAVEAKVGPLE